MLVSLGHYIEPIFCDINPDDYTIDEDKLEPLIAEKTYAINPVHVYGNLCHIRKIEKIAKKYNLKVIFDAAYAFGVTADGINTSSFGDTSIFSFHATKVYNTIEGGAVTFKEPSLRKKLKYLKNHSITGHDTVEDVGCNAKMNEFQASLGLCNLRYVDKKIIKRAKVVERYNEGLPVQKALHYLCPKKELKVIMPITPWFLLVTGIIVMESMKS